MAGQASRWVGGARALSHEECRGDSREDAEDGDEGPHFAPGQLVRLHSGIVKETRL